MGPHPEWGEEVVAFVVVQPGAEIATDALDRLCLDHIACFKRPRHYRFVGALPKNNPDYALFSANKAWYKTGTHGCFCGFERWRATRCNFKRGSARPSLLFFMEQRISAGRR